MRFHPGMGVADPARGPGDNDPVAPSWRDVEFVGGCSDGRPFVWRSRRGPARAKVPLPIDIFTKLSRLAMFDLGQETRGVELRLIF